MREPHWARFCCLTCANVFSEGISIGRTMIGGCICAAWASFLAILKQICVLLPGNHMFRSKGCDARILSSKSGSDKPLGMMSTKEYDDLLLMNSTVR